MAVGLGTRVGDRDLIVTSGKQAQLGARLDLLQQAILVVSEHELDRIQQVACSETMTLVDLPTVMLRRGQHARAVLRYAVLVDPRDGRLASIVWRIDVGADGSYELADGPAVRTPPNLHQTCLLHVDGKELILGIPTPMAFATPAMPSGQPVELPRALREIAGRKLLTAEMVRRIEAGLRRAIGLRPVR